MDELCFLPRWEYYLVDGWMMLPQVLAVAYGAAGANWTMIGVRTWLVAACVGVFSLFVPAKILFVLMESVESTAFTWLTLLVFTPFFGAATGYFVSRWVANILRRRTAN